MGFRVKPEYRTNPLSLKKTNKVVCVERAVGSVLEYDNIHSPWAYIKVIKRKNPSWILKTWWFKEEPEKINIIK